jgi:hypothetical protein
MMGEHCSVWVDKGQGLGGYCDRKPVKNIDGKWYCKFHLPERVKAREKKRQEEYDANHREWEKRHKREMMILGIFGGIDGTVIEENIDKLKRAIKGICSPTPNGEGE